MGWVAGAGRGRVGGRWVGVARVLVRPPPDPPRRAPHGLPMLFRGGDWSGGALACGGTALQPSQRQRPTTNTQVWHDWFVVQQLNAPRRGVQRRRVATGTQRVARPTPTRARGRKCRGWPVLLHAQLTPHADVHERGWERDNERTTRGTVHEALKPGEHHAMRAHRDNEVPRMRRDDNHVGALLR